ncbi:MAG: BT4734/BF3469 family protein [Balneolaceae bacterium]|nr:BT4734/BF3469 family protein [Balneolaceae bacterium]
MTHLKATLPAITPSGQFSYRSKEKLIEHSGLIQFDIDGKDHINIANFKALKEEISKIVNVAYVGLSVSGKGYWGLIPIKYPEKHKNHFKAMKNAFGNYGIKLDDKPSHVASLRGYSYDPDAYFSHNAKPLELLYESNKSSNQSGKRKTYRFQTDSHVQVQRLVKQVEDRRIDITDSYDIWLKIGFALADEFGESGREYFHSVSQFYPGYNERETDQQYSHCLRTKGKGAATVTIATFFHYCKANGVTLN